MTATLRLDLGCGNKDRPGFFGLDRTFLAGVDVVADLDAAHLPFGDSSFDLIVAVHSLEHVAELVPVIREIGRIGKPGAQVAIAAPYGPNLLDFANPYHRQIFNEHTPRFWTAAPSTPIDPAEWVEPPLGPFWGLSQSDNHDPGFDLRCVRMEFFYFRDYWRQSPARVRAARKRYLSVCEQILYHLVVFKPPLAESDLEPLHIDPYFPRYIAERRSAAAAARRRWLGGWWRLLPGPREG
ncbi:MAG: class I SAM-dependent methyltransferase [bacterium]|nr:class I SAM-dependent methyltransferase [bacterium]